MGTKKKRSATRIPFTFVRQFHNQIKGKHFPRPALARLHRRHQSVISHTVVVCLELMYQKSPRESIYRRSSCSDLLLFSSPFDFVDGSNPRTKLTIDRVLHSQCNTNSGVRMLVILLQFCSILNHRDRSYTPKARSI